MGKETAALKWREISSRIIGNVIALGDVEGGAEAGRRRVAAADIAKRGYRWHSRVAEENVIHIHLTRAATQVIKYGTANQYGLPSRCCAHYGAAIIWVVQAEAGKTQIDFGIVFRGL